MGLSHSPQTVTDGLVFYYDMGNPQKSWKGKPTTNFAYTQNARTDAAYSAYSATALGTWNAKHPDAIRVYNDSGSEISAYSNTGVTDWTNTYHAIWTLDPILNRPVVTMRDFDGNWKAKSFGLGQTMTSMGLGYGSTYTISWLQWTDDIAKSANAGLYGQNTSASNNFHDGLSNSSGTSYNTLPYTWQRVYATFTVSGVWNLSAGLTCYMYGHYIKRGTVKIADVQIETGVPSGFSKQQTRSNTQAVLDLTNNNTITANALTYNADGTVGFNGSTNYISIPSFSLGSTDPIVSINQWIKRTASFTNGGYWGLGGGSSNNGINSYTSVSNKIGWDLWGQTTFHTGQDYPLNQWVNVCWVKTGATFTTSTLKIYINGVEVPLTTTVRNNSSVVNLRTSLTIGRLTDNTNLYYAPGDVGVTQVFSKALSAAEVQQNFNALRGRYGI